MSRARFQPAPRSPVPAERPRAPPTARVSLGPARCPLSSADLHVLHAASKRFFKGEITWNGRGRVAGAPRPQGRAPRVGARPAPRRPHQPAGSPGPQGQVQDASSTSYVPSAHRTPSVTAGDRRTHTGFRTTAGQSCEDRQVRPAGGNASETGWWPTADRDTVRAGSQEAARGAAAVGERGSGFKQTRAGADVG